MADVLLPSLLECARELARLRGRWQAARDAAADFAASPAVYADGQIERWHPPADGLPEAPDLEELEAAADEAQEHARLLRGVGEDDDADGDFDGSDA